LVLESDLIKETLWDAVRKSGKTSASLIWPVSVGAPIDYIQKVWTLDSSYGRIKPMEDNERTLKKTCCFRKNGYYYL
jgi:hypothetical protein